MSEGPFYLAHLDTVEAHMIAGFRLARMAREEAPDGNPVVAVELLRDLKWRRDVLKELAALADSPEILELVERAEQLARELGGDARALVTRMEEILSPTAGG